jgi:cytochrome d ubiquinol oxidase subunit II
VRARIRDTAYRLIPYLSLRAARLPGRRVRLRPYLFVFPVIGALATAVLAASVRHRLDGPPVIMVALFSLPHLRRSQSRSGLHDPFTITVAEAAAPHSTLAFMFLGAGLFVFPLMLLYTAISLSVFRGKIRATADHY